MRGHEERDPNQQLRERLTLYADVSGTIEHSSGFKATGAMRGGGLIAGVALGFFGVCAVGIWQLKPGPNVQIVVFLAGAVVALATIVALLREQGRRNATDIDRRAQSPPEFGTERAGS
jgi:hypothetical protein